MQRDSHTRSELIRLIGEGLSFRSAAKQAGVSLDLLYKLLKSDPLFRTEWEQARKDAADTLSDDVLDAFDGAETVADAMIARGRSDNLKTVAGWRNPTRYSPRMNVEVTHTVDLAGALRQAEMRTIPILEQAQLERSGSGIPETAMLPGCIPPVAEQAPAPHQHNNNEDLKTALKMPDSYEKARLLESARQHAEKDYHEAVYYPKVRMGRPPNPPAPPPIEVPDTRTPVDIEAVHRVLGIEQDTGSVDDQAPTPQADGNEHGT